MLQLNYGRHFYKAASFGWFENQFVNTVFSYYQIPQTGSKVTHLCYIMY